MKNFPLVNPETGKTEWISRAMAVVAIILAYDDSRKPYLFLQKRGPGCPDYQGCWSHTCGYLDFDETLKEAVGREIYEEIGFGITKLNSKVTTHSINDHPEQDPRQNVTIRYVVQVKLQDLKDAISINSESRGGESGEVTEFMIVPVSELSLNSIEFAFNHKDLTENILQDPRFIASKEDRYFGLSMHSDEATSYIVVNNYIRTIYVKRDLAGVITMECPDLGVTFTPAGLPKDIVSYIRANIKK